MPYSTKDIKNYSKHMHQMNFKGIVHSDNIFEVEQESFKDTNNVFVNEDMMLVSRAPIVGEQLPVSYILDGSQTIETSIVPDGYSLVDIYETGKVVVYISINDTDQFTIVAREKATGLLTIMTELVTEYHVAAIEKYLIVFNDVDARVIDTNSYSTGWQLLRDLAHIPITKRVVGQETFENPANLFTESYKEQYIWSEDILPVLPDGDAEVVITKSPDDLTWQLPNANINTEFRLLDRLNCYVSPTDLVSVATNDTLGITMMAVGRSDHVIISYDAGQTFERVLYPTHNGFLQIASISDDGLHYFFVAVDGVFRYDLGLKTWDLLREGDLPASTAPQLEGTGIVSGRQNTAKFINAEVFTFVLYREDVGVPITRVYWRGPGLQTKGYVPGTLGYTEITASINPLIQINKTRQDISPFSVTISGDDTNSVVTAWLSATTATSTYMVNMFSTSLDTYDYTVATVVDFENLSGTYVDGETVYITETGTYYIHNGTIWIGADPILVEQTLDNAYGIIVNATRSTQLVHPDTGFAIDAIELECITDNNGIWVSARALIGRQYNTPDWLTFNEFQYGLAIGSVVDTNGAPLFLETGHINNMTTLTVDGIANLPSTLDDNEDWPDPYSRDATVTNGKYYYMIIGTKIFTNDVSSKIVTITYTRESATPYTNIPDVTHVNNELYLGFGNTLSITNNFSTGTDIQFNLPIINDQGFTSNINGLINISTTEVAVFLIDDIIISTKVADDLLGYRYDYLTTRLSNGIRQGDTVINTKDGGYTLYPTSKGLAVMNYQADVATTDQVVEYVTDNIVSLWPEFYKINAIKIIQMNDYIFLTNSTKDYLMLDLRTMSWWKFSSPVNVSKLLTDQTNLYIVNNGLYKFNEDYITYRDLSTEFIDWKIESQLLHFSAPAHYKNIKQLIYQLKESNVKEQTILSQIKLYRKVISTREPDTVGFVVDGYRPFVKRFNYWKINQLQWGMAADPETKVPARLQLNGITIKYERGEEVR